MLAFDVRQLQMLTPPIVAQAVHLFDPEDGTLPSGGRGTGAPERSRSAWIHYWLGADAAVSLEVFDDAGSSVAVLDAQGFTGLHMAEWDLTRARGEPADPSGFQRPSFVRAGTYTAVLTVDGVRYETTVRVGAGAAR
jgi:hypothetical protein